MPKIRKPPEVIAREARDAVVHEILMIRTDLGLRQHDIADALNVTDGAVSIMLKDLDKIRIPKLRQMIRMLHPSPRSVLLWLGYTEKEIKEINKEVAEIEHSA